jgi:hypothetical protein
MAISLSQYSLFRDASGKKGEDFESDINHWLSKYSKQEFFERTNPPTFLTLSFHTSYYQFMKCFEFN